MVLLISITEEINGSGGEDVNSCLLWRVMHEQRGGRRYQLRWTSIELSLTSNMNESGSQLMAIHFPRFRWGGGEAGPWAGKNDGGAGGSVIPEGGLCCG